MELFCEANINIVIDCGSLHELHVHVAEAGQPRPVRCTYHHGGAVDVAAASPRAHLSSSPPSLSHKKVQC